MTVHKQHVVIWDFDGVLCDSLAEVAAVTRLAAHMLESDSDPDDAQVRALCNAQTTAKLYLKLSPLRPYIVRGQDYLWQYYHYDILKPCISEPMTVYQQTLAQIRNDAQEKIYEHAFYNARKRLTSALGDAYLALFRGYPGALQAIAASIRLHRTYVCTNRDQNGVSVLLGSGGISFPQARIYSKDRNGDEENITLSKTEQVLRVLDQEGGRDQDVLIVEDQVKTPQELQDLCPRLRTIYTSYGYGLRADWDAAKLRNCRTVRRADQLLQIIEEAALP